MAQQRKRIGPLRRRSLASSRSAAHPCTGSWPPAKKRGGGRGFEPKRPQYSLSHQALRHSANGGSRM